MHVLDLTLPTLAENLALDEALLLAAESGQGGEVLRLWEWTSPAVVLGAAGKLHEDVEVARCEREGIAIQRRSSGGGTVLLNRGCLLFSLVLRFDRHPALTEIATSYQFILSQIARALSPGVGVIGIEGICDLTLEGQKFSGNAQQRKRLHLLHHGTLLYAMEKNVVGWYLRMPGRMPNYRKGRNHHIFLRNLPLSDLELKCRLQRAWETETELPTWPSHLVEQLIGEKYAFQEWIRRR
jgi:lipoate-protein ligase A